ncbi:hypothetical protein QUF72_09750 [Desulfobacterales bacterium HSG2]|nr:hypothetical protein [Desulfobacterales bacterium HSG2]
MRAQSFGPAGTEQLSFQRKRESASLVRTMHPTPDLRFGQLDNLLLLILLLILLLLLILTCFCRDQD